MACFRKGRTIRAVFFLLILLPLTIRQFKVLRNFPSSLNDEIGYINFVLPFPPVADNNYTDFKNQTITTKKTTSNHTTLRDDASQTTIESNRNYFILHLGPMKTGTTTIQCALRNLEESDVLRKYNFKLLETENCRPSKVERSMQQQQMQETKTTTPGGKATYFNVVSGVSWLPGCWLKWEKGKGMPACWKRSYERYLRENNRTSMIISNENIMKVVSTIRKQNNSNHFVNDLVNSLQDAGDYHLIVVATYRRFFEWSLSVHHERNDLIDNVRPAHQKFPGKGGFRIETMYDVLASGVVGFYRNQHVERAIEFFSSNENVTFQLINIHTGDLEHNFYCKAFPNTTQLHQHLCFPGMHMKETTRLNQAVDVLWYDALAVEAYQRGLLPEGSPRRKVVKSIATFQEQQNMTQGRLPSICPSDKIYGRFLNESLRRERRLLPSLSAANEKVSAQELESQHRQAFEKAKSLHKFCTIDVDAVLNDTKWRTFFRDLKTT